MPKKVYSFYNNTKFKTLDKRRFGFYIIPFEVPWVRYNAQFLYPQLSCHHEPAVKGLLGNCKTKERPQVSPLLGTGLASQILTRAGARTHSPITKGLAWGHVCS